jgi:hypothetical protein
VEDPLAPTIQRLRPQLRRLAEMEQVPEAAQAVERRLGPVEARLEEEPQREVEPRLVEGLLAVELQPARTPLQWSQPVAELRLLRTRRI